MAFLDYQNKNTFTPYPFTNNGTGVVLNEWFTDCNIVLGPSADFSYTSNDIYLKSITVSGGNTWVVVLSTNTTTPITFSFTFTSANGEYQTAWAEANEGAEFGFGFLSVGRPNYGMSTIPSGTLTPLNVYLVKSLIQNLSGKFVNTINVANRYGTQRYDATCSDSAPNTGYETLITGLTGDIIFKAGRFMTLDLAPTNNTITFSPVKERLASGDPSCAPIRVLPGSYDPDTKETKCLDTVVSFNGVNVNNGTNTFFLNDNQGISIAASGLHSITMTIYPLVIFSDPVTPVYCSSNGHYIG